MKKIKIDNKMFGYRILPVSGYVYAEIYYTKLNQNVEIQVLNQEFGSIWRSPIKSDYDKAEVWARNQLRCIREANL